MSLGHYTTTTNNNNVLPHTPSIPPLCAYKSNKQSLLGRRSCGWAAQQGKAEQACEADESEARQSKAGHGGNVQLAALSVDRLTGRPQIRGASHL